ncbi:MAG TPA: sugar ABC transporter permease [Lentisphaeria bacterium]|nr:MAG: hypothetical protein A2X45_25170 [Lentisphaerae bacterium GWF2_50_93]HCE42104.1 sugar ABC transporter permease [Lentisphaeria bacterium]
MPDFRTSSVARYAVQYGILVAVSVTTVFPLVWMIGTSLKSAGDPVMSFLPDHPTMSNFARAIEGTSFTRYYINSIIIAVVSTFGQLLTSSMAGFAFARLNFPGRDKIFFAYLATMMIPGAVTMVPLFMIMTAGPEYLNILLGTGMFTEKQYFLNEYYAGRALGIDSYFTIIVPHFFSPFGVFLMRQFFLTIPKEMDEAASIDGCSTFQIYFHVILPMSKPALGALSIFVFMGTWGEFLWPLIMTNSDAMKNLPVGIASFMGEHSTDWPLIMAASTMMMIPMVCVFIAFQKFFVSGIQTGAVKG